MRWDCSRKSGACELCVVLGKVLINAAWRLRIGNLGGFPDHKLSRGLSTVCECLFKGIRESFIDLQTGA
jgi:hypothetical protein